MINVEQTIISQYRESETLTQLITNMNGYIDPTSDIDGFYNYVLNINTAKGFGLDIIGRIVNVSRNLKLSASDKSFGFYEALPGSYPFNDEPFWDSITSDTGTYSISDEAYRKLLFVKCISNISSVDAPSLNQLLQNLFFGRGRCYVNDLGGMLFRYSFEFLLTVYEIAVLTQSGAVPRPAGVETIISGTQLPYFGFASAGSRSVTGFGQAPFMQRILHVIE